MLTVQPKFLNTYRPAFKADVNNVSENFEIMGMDEDAYESFRDDIKTQRKDLEDLINDTEAKFPKFVKKIMKAGVVIATGLLGGMATGWGAGKSIDGIKVLSKKAPVQKAKNTIKSAFKFAKKVFGFAVKLFKKTKFYKKPVEKATKFFTENNFGKKLASAYNKFKNSKIVASAKDGFKYIIDKIKGIKGETYKKAVVNTVGVSGGIASGVSAIKEKGESGAEE